jgi:hypothetical protein
MLLANVRGGINSLMAEVMEDHIRHHLLSTERNSTPPHELAEDMIDGFGPSLSAAQAWTGSVRRIPRLGSADRRTDGRLVQFRPIIGAKALRSQPKILDS